MPVLFALSILAFVALLWATISIAGFVRRARRSKHRRINETPNPIHNAGFAAFTEENPARYPVVDPAQPPAPIHTGLQEPTPEKNNIQPESAFFLSDDEIPVSVDGVALPLLDSGPSLSPPPVPRSSPKSVHSDGIH